MERIVFLDRKTCRAELRPPRFLHEWKDYDVTTRAQVPERLLDATMAITNKVPLRQDELKDLRALRYIGVAATGVDVVDLTYCNTHGITVTNVPHYAARSVAEHVFMLVLALRRSLVHYRMAVRGGLWSASPVFSLMDYPLHNLAGSTLGIIGYGEIGQAVEQLGKAFGMEVLVAERRHALEVRPGRTEFKEVLGRSDVVTLHCPLNAETRKLVGSTELTRMKPRALLINTARGGLVDEEALAHALRSGLLGGAGLDVLSQEPPPEDNPLIYLDAPNLLITPHNAWASEQSVAVLAGQLIDNLEAFVAGKPKNVIHS